MQKYSEGSLSIFIVDLSWVRLYYECMMNQEFVLPTRDRVQELKDLYCDCYKDVHGIKARWVYGMDLTEAELENMMARLGEEHAFNQEDMGSHVAAANEAKARERIQALIDHGARNVVRAIRWLHEAEGTDGDDRLLDFTLGTRYGFIDEVLQKGL